MTRRAHAQVLAAAVLVAAWPSLAQSSPQYPEWLSRIELGGRAFLFYYYDATEGAGALNAFDIGRMYLWVIANPADHVRFKMTLDAPGREDQVRVSGGVTTVDKGAGRFDVVLKHAYGEIYDVPFKGLFVKFGMHDLPWGPYAEKIWGYRFQGPVFTDREGYLSSTDLGLGVGYTVPGKWGEAAVSLVNGETWSKAEANRHKDVHARLTVRPFAASKVGAGLALSVFGSLGTYAEGTSQARHRFVAQAAFTHEYALLAVEYLRAWDPPGRLVSRHPSLAASTDAVVSGQGLSASGWLDLGLFGVARGLRLVARVDQLDPDVHLAGNSHTREIFGVGYSAGKHVQLLVDGELVQYEASAGLTDERRFFVHTQFEF